MDKRNLEGIVLFIHRVNPELDGTPIPYQVILPRSWAWNGLVACTCSVCIL